MLAACNSLGNWCVFVFGRLSFLSEASGSMEMLDTGQLSVHCQVARVVPQQAKGDGLADSWSCAFHLHTVFVLIMGSFSFYVAYVAM